MERADIAKLWQLEEIAAAGHHELAANLRTAINELVKVRAAPEGRADLDALEHMAEWFTHGRSARYDAHAKLVRTAIAEIRDLRTRHVSCEACNGMARMVAVLEEECRASRRAHPNPLAPNLIRARLATDENGGLGA